MEGWRASSLLASATHMVLVGVALPLLVFIRESRYPLTGGEVPVPAILGTVLRIFQRREDMLITREGN
jgi:hypothetical protein